MEHRVSVSFQIVTESEVTTEEILHYFQARFHQLPMPYGKPCMVAVERVGGGFGDETETWPASGA